MRKPKEVGSSKAVQALAAWYRDNGESDHVAAVEATLVDGWRSTAELAERSQHSRKYVREVLEYLVLEGRAERATAKVEGTRGWHFIWRLPSPPETT